MISNRIRSNAAAPRIACNLFAIGALTAAIPVAAETNLLRNGNFEQPDYRFPTNFRVVPVGSDFFPDWLVTGVPRQNVALVEETYSPPEAAGIAMDAALGRQWIDLTGDGSNRNNGVMQSVTLAPGRYHLRFSVGNVARPQSGLGLISTVQLWIDGALVQSYTNAESDAQAVHWREFSHDFNGNGATTIEFRNGDALDDNLNGLDHVVLTSVPEPGTYALLALGLAALGVRARRPGPNT